MKEREIYAATFGRLVHRLRTASRLTQCDVAHRTGWSQARISKIEAGLVLPDVFELPILAGALTDGRGYTGSYLLIEADRGRAKVERMALKLNAKHAWKRTSRTMLQAIVRMAVDR